MSTAVLRADTSAALPNVKVEPEWVLASKFEELTGVTHEAVKQRKKSGVWQEGREVVVVARRIYVNIKAADKWINDQISQRRRA